MIIRLIHESIRIIDISFLEQQWMEIFSRKCPLRIIRFFSMLPCENIAVALIQNFRWALYVSTGFLTYFYSLKISIQIGCTVGKLIPSWENV